MKLLASMPAYEYQKLLEAISRKKYPRCTHTPEEHETYKTLCALSGVGPTACAYLSMWWWFTQHGRLDAQDLLIDPAWLAKCP